MEKFLQVRTIFQELKKWSEYIVMVWEGELVSPSCVEGVFLKKMCSFFFVLLSAGLCLFKTYLLYTFAAELL